MFVNQHQFSAGPNATLFIDYVPYLFYIEGSVFRGRSCSAKLKIIRREQPNVQHWLTLLLTHDFEQFSSAFSSLGRGWQGDLVLHRSRNKLAVRRWRARHESTPYRPGDN